MKLNFNDVQGFAVPENLFQLINTELADQTTPANTFNAITLNFRDPCYSHSTGGYIIKLYHYSVTADWLLSFQLTTVAIALIAVDVILIGLMLRIQAESK